jgi:hypothetical protein
MTDLVGIGLSKLKPPNSHRFIVSGNTSIEHYLFDVSEAERESVIPVAVGDDLDWEAMAYITNAHPLSLTWTVWTRAVELINP